MVCAAVSVPVLAQSEPIVLKGMTPWTPDYASSKPFFMFQELIEERLQGRVKLEYLGGPEVVPAFEQFEALRNGVVDVVLGAAAYYTAQVPEASAMLLARKSPQEQRESGYYDLMRDIHRTKGDVVYLSNLTGVPNVGFRLYLNKQIDEPDLTGLKIRVSPVYVPLVNGLGGTPINMPTTEIYTALERGVVDGYGQTYVGIMDFALHEVTEYVVNVPFYSKDNALLVNADTWDGLPDDIRAAIDEIGIEVENRVTEFEMEKIADEDALLKEAGLKFIEFDDAQKEKYLEAAYDARWKELLEQSPEYGPKLRDLGG
jgi:TRAP-type C4-dicarboxylate transport system substrate-binding protein